MIMCGFTQSVIFQGNGIINVSIMQIYHKANLLQIFWVKTFLITQCAGVLKFKIK